MNVSLRTRHKSSTPTYVHCRGEAKIHKQTQVFKKSQSELNKVLKHTHFGKALPNNLNEDAVRMHGRVKDEKSSDEEITTRELRLERNCCCNTDSGNTAANLG